MPRVHRSAAGPFTGPRDIDLANAPAPMESNTGITPRTFASTGTSAVANTHTRTRTRTVAGIKAGTVAGVTTSAVASTNTRTGSRAPTSGVITNASINVHTCVGATATATAWVGPSVHTAKQPLDIDTAQPPPPDAERRRVSPAEDLSELGRQRGSGAGHGTILGVSVRCRPASLASVDEPRPRDARAPV